MFKVGCFSEKWDIGYIKDNLSNLGFFVIRCGLDVRALVFGVN